MSGGLRSADPLWRPLAPAKPPGGAASAADANGASVPGSDQGVAIPGAVPAGPYFPSAGPFWPAAASSWARAFPGGPRQVSAARRFVSSLLEGSPLHDDAVIVISELFTNALQHSDSGRPGGLVVVQVSRWLLGVRIAVTDQGSPHSPQIRGVAAEAEAATNGANAHMMAGDVPQFWAADVGDGLRDAGDRLPDAEDWPADSGRGLFMVSSLACHLDWHDDACGRTVHAVLGRPPAPSPNGASPNGASPNGRAQPDQAPVRPAPAGEPDRAAGGRRT